MTTKLELGALILLNEKVLAPAIAHTRQHAQEALAKGGGEQERALIVACDLAYDGCSYALAKATKE